MKPFCTVRVRVKVRVRVRVRVRFRVRVRAGRRGIIRGINSIRFKTSLGPGTGQSRAWA